MARCNYGIAITQEFLCTLKIIQSKCNLNGQHYANQLFQMKLKKKKNSSYAFLWYICLQALHCFFNKHWPNTLIFNQYKY